MTGDIVYADIKTARDFPLKHSSSHPRSDSHHHGIFLKIGCAMIIILLVTVIVLSIFLIQFKSSRHNKVGNESKEKYYPEKNESGTITSRVCSNSSTAQKSCPSIDWELHGGKCYCVVTHMKSWNESKIDCAMKNSHLMVIRDFIDMSFLWQHFTGVNSYWIGLSIPFEGLSWTWVDNNSFDPHLFSTQGNKQRASANLKCAQVSRVGVAPRKCEEKKQWICQL